MRQNHVSDEVRSISDDPHQARGLFRLSGLAALTCRNLFRARAFVPYITRRRAIAPLERAVEIGQIAKTSIISDCANRALGEPWLRQHPMGATQPLRKQKFGKRCAFAFKQPLQVAWSQLKKSRDT